MSYQRVSRFFAVLLIAILALSACSPATQPPAQPQPTEAPEQPVETEAAAPETSAKPSGKLTIWVQQANQDVFEKTILPDFQAEYPDIEIEFVNYPPDEVANQMTLAIQGGTGGPDLGFTETENITKLVELEGLMDLTQKMEPYNATMNPPALAEGTKDGKIYSVPWDIGPVVTFYRRDIFKAAGLSDDPEEVSALLATWDDYLSTCEKIKEETGLLCFSLNKANNYGDVFLNMLWQQDLDLYSDEGEILVDGPEYVATLEKLGEFWSRDLVSDELEWTDNWYAILKANIDDPNVKPVATIPIAAWMGNFLKTWVAAEQNGNWGVALMPAFTEGGTRAANQGGSSAFIPTSSSNPDAAWAFIDFMLLRNDNQIKLFEFSDYFPANAAVYNDPLFDQGDEYFGGQATRQVYAQAAQEIPVSNQYGQYAGTIRGTLATAVQKYAMGQMSAEEALQEAANNIRTEIGQ